MGVQRLSRRSMVRATCGAAALLASSVLAACGSSSVSNASGSVSTTARTAANPGTATTGSAATPAAASAVRAGAQTVSGSSTTSAPAAAATTATLAAKTLEFMRPSGSPAEDKAYIAMLSGWASEHPGAKASFVSAPYANYETKLLTEIAGGVVRDVIGLLPGDMTVFAAKKAVIPLDAYVARSPQLQKADFFPAHWADGQYQGKQWGIPPDGSPLVVAYNVDLFQANSVAEPTATWTWNDCVATAQKLTKRSGSRTTQFGCSFSGTGNVLCWLFANDANVLDVATNTTTIDSANAVQTLAYLGDLNNKYHVNPLPAEQSEFGANIFLSGKVGMVIANRGGLGTAYRTAPFKINTVALPEAPASGHSGSQITPLQLVIETPNKHPDDAWVLLQYLASAASQLARFTQFGGYPSRRSVANDPKFLASVAPSWVGTQVNKVFAQVADAPGAS
jgi:multiple sugar transport system substrate-binding protein